MIIHNVSITDAITSSDEILSDSSTDNINNKSLERFIAEHNKKDIKYGTQFNKVLYELSKGKKRSCWVWYIFPQIIGLSMSYTGKLYSIKTLEESSAYASHTVLRNNLIKSIILVNKNLVDGLSVRDIFSIDEEKYISCMTLFLITSAETGDRELFDLCYKSLQLGNKGKPDKKTIKILIKKYPKYKFLFDSEKNN